MDPLAAVPLVPPGIATAPGPGGGLVLTQELPDRGPVAAWFSRRLGLARSRRIVLDARGAFYWSRIDGTTPLSTIVHDLRTTHGLPDRDARDAVVLFTKMLLRRGLVVLRLTPPAPRA